MLWWSHTGISCLAECILWWVMRGHIASWRMRHTQTVWTASSGLTMGCASSLAARMGLLTSGNLNGSTGPHCSCLWAQSCLGKWFGTSCCWKCDWVYICKPEIAHHDMMLKVWSKLSGYQTWPAVCPLVHWHICTITWLAVFYISALAHNTVTWPVLCRISTMAH